MGYIRKALSITTLGLSSLVLEDDSKRTAQTAEPAERKRRPQKPRPKAKAKARAKASTPTAARSKSRPKRSQPNAAAQPKAAGKAVRKRATARARPSAAAQPKARTATQPKAQAPPQAPAAKTPAAASGTVIALERIAKLHAVGGLTDQEFAAAKARILGTGPTAPTQGGAHATFPAIEANVAAARRLHGLTGSERDALETTTPSGLPRS
jgi:hypothetical protein